MESTSDAVDNEKLHQMKLLLEQGDFDSTLPELISVYYERGKEIIFPDKSTPLHYACQHGNLRATQLLVNKYKSNVSHKNDEGFTPLFLSAKHGHLDLVIFLLTFVICNSSPIQLLNPNEKLYDCLKSKFLVQLAIHKDNNDNSVLHAACSSGSSLPMIKYLTKIGLDPNSTNKEGMSCLHLAVKHGCLNTVRYLIEEASCDPFLIDSKERAPVYIAAEKGHLDILKYLIENKGIDSHFKTIKEVRGRDVIQPSGRTLLHVASREGHYDTVKYLVSSCQLSPSARDDGGRTPIFLSCLNEKLDVLNYLILREFVLGSSPISHKSGKLYESLQNTFRVHFKQHHFDDMRNTPLHAACANKEDSIEVVKFLHRILGINPTQANRNDTTCLHVAAGSGNLKVVKYLLEHAQSNHALVDSQGRSAAYLACIGGHLSILKYLIEEGGADGHFKTTVELETAASKCGSGRSLLHAASSGGHLDVIKYLVESCGCDPALKDKKYITSLFLACQKGHIESVKYLMSLGCDINDKVLEDRTAIHGAATSGNLELIKHLDSLGFSFKSADEKGSTPLFYACASGNIEVVSYLICHHKLSPHHKDNNGTSCLHAACLSKSITLVKYLIEDCKCDPQSPDERGSTSLHYACSEGSVDIIGYLITVCGCDPNLKNYVGLTCLHAAAACDSVETCQLLIEEYGCDLNCENINKNTPFWIACTCGNIEVIKYLGSHNPHLDSSQFYLHASIISLVKDDNLYSVFSIVKYLIEALNCTQFGIDELGMTVLHLTIALGDTKTAYYLMKEYSCDPKTPSNGGRSCLLDAISSCDFDMIKYLVEHWHCDPTIKDDKGRTPFYTACACGKIDMVQYFVTNNYYSLDTTKDGRSCLHAAAFVGSLDLVKYLVMSCGAEADCKDSNGLTPLTLACRFGNVGIVEYLLSLNCDPGNKYGNGKSCVHAAVLSEKVEVVKCVASESIIDAPDNDGSSPLHIACSLNNFKIVQYLISWKCDPGRKANVENTLGISNTVSCLHIAGCSGNLDIIECLVSNTNVDINLKDALGSTVVYLACGLGHSSIVQFLSLQDSCDINCVSDDGRSCFHAAARSGKLEIVKCLVERKCNLYEGKDNEGVTPLHMACAFGTKDIVLFLINELGCDPYSKTNKNASCFDIALFYGKLNIIKYLMEEFKYEVGPDDSGDPILFIPCKGGHLDAVKYLIDNNKCDISCTNNQGWTCLVAAILGKDLELIKFLIEEHHCDPLHLDNRGLTPFYASCELGHLEIAQYLIDHHHCDPNWSSVEGRSCLEGAIISGNLELVKLFVEKHNCNPFIENTLGLTPFFVACAIGDMLIVCYLATLPQCDLNYCSSLMGYSCIHAAVLGGNRGIVEYLVEDQNCNPNLSTERGVTPLYLACEEGHVDIFKYLLGFTICNPNQKTADGRTCVHAAVVSGNVQVLNFLIAICHCDPHCKSNYGVTPLHIACELGHIDVVEYLINCTQSDPNDKATNGWSSFHYAASQNHTNVIKYLSKDSYDPNMKKKKVISPFYKILLMERMEMEKGLLQRGRNLDNASSSILSSLQTAAALCKDTVNDMDAIGARTNINGPQGVPNNPLPVLVRPQKSNLAKKDEESYLYDSNCPDSSERFKGELKNQEYSPLHLACHQGFLETIKYLVLSKQYDPRSLLPDGQSCLHCASSGGDLPTIKYLVEEHNCDPNCTDSAGITPLLVACRKGFTEVVKYFVSQTNASHPHVRSLLFQMAVRCGHLDLVQYLVTDLQCDLNRDKLIAPLYIASTCGHLDIAMYLVEKHHSDPLKKSANQDSPLHAAARNGHLEIVKYFVGSIGVDPSPEGEAGNTPLHYAVCEGFVDIIDYLLDEAHCDLSCRDHASQTPFHRACTSGNLEVLKCLSKYIFFTNEPLLDGRNNSPLHLAAANGHLDVVKFLMGSDDPEGQYIPQLISNPNTRNLQGNTPSDEARRHNHMKICHYLEYMEKLHKSVMSHTSITEATKMLVLGNPSAGKSTLIEALSEGSLLGRFFSVLSVKSRASGSVSPDIEKDEFGKISVFYFVGDQRYSITHDYVLQQFNCPLCLLVVNFSLPLKEVESQVCYWRSLLCNSSVHRKMNVIVVASHVDTDKAKRNMDDLKSKLHQLIPFGRNVNGINFHDFICCNCRFSGTGEMKQLRQLIGTVKKESCLPLSSPDNQLPLLGTSLVKYFKFLCSSKQCMTLQNIHQELSHLEGRDGKLMILSQIQKLHEVCMYLKSVGHLLYFEHNSDINRNTVVLNDSHLLESLNAFWIEVQSSVNNEFGILEESKMNAILNMKFSNIAGHSLAINCLFISHLSCNIARDQLITDQNKLPARDSSYYFFPDLVPPVCERPISSKLWFHGYSKLFTWCMGCAKYDQIFTEKFAHSLFCELISSRSSQVRVMIWKDGVLLDDGRTLCVVELVNRRTQIHVVIQYSNQCEMNMVMLRSNIIALIKSILQLTCPDLETNEYFLLPQTAYPLSVDIRLNCADIASAMINNHHDVPFDSGIKGKVSLSDILIFDVFQEMDSYDIQTILKLHTSCEAVSQVLVERVCKGFNKLPNMSPCVQEFLNVSTYQDLYQKLLKYTIFSDGTILVRFFC